MTPASLPIIKTMAQPPIGAVAEYRIWHKTANSGKFLRKFFR